MLAELFSFSEIFAMSLGFVGLSIAVLVQCRGGNRTLIKTIQSDQKMSPTSNVINSNNSKNLARSPNPHKRKVDESKKNKNSMPSRKKSHSRRFSSSTKGSKFMRSTDKKTLGSTMRKVHTGEARISEEEPHKSDDT